LAWHITTLFPLVFYREGSCGKGRQFDVSKVSWPGSSGEVKMEVHEVLEGEEQADK